MGFFSLRKDKTEVPEKKEPPEPIPERREPAAPPAQPQVQVQQTPQKPAAPPVQQRPATGPAPVQRPQVQVQQPRPPEQQIRTQPVQRPAAPAPAEPVREPVRSAAAAPRTEPANVVPAETVSKGAEPRGKVTEPPRPAEADGPTEEVGKIYGNVGTSSFNCRVIAHVERAEYVMVEHADYGNVLCQIGSLIRKTDLSLEKSATVTKDTKIDEMISATVDVIGYRDEKGLLQSPRTTFHAGASVRRASGALIQKVLGLRASAKVGAYIGLLHGHDIPVALDINSLLQKHVCILAKSGGGKSYISGDIVEELMKHNVTCMIIDPHGEYGAMRDKGNSGDARFGVVTRGYGDHIIEFSISKEVKDAKPLRFTLRSLEAREILELTRTNDVKTFLPSLRKAIDLLREKQDVYSVRELIDVLMNDGDGKNSVLIAELEYLEEVGLFATRGNPISELIVLGKTTIINLKGVPPDIQELVVRRLSTLLFEMRKIDKIPPLLLILEEAHNYCPQQGSALSSKALSTIASEGRKFGLGLMVISQRPAKIDKNVLSQCGTQIILKLTNPNDLKAVAASVEGLTNGMTDEVQTMPIGMAMIVGAGIEAPLLVDVRPRESRHGGSGVKVLREDDD